MSVRAINKGGGLPVKDGDIGEYRPPEAKNKAWFDENRKRYEAVYLDPAKAFVAAIGPELQKVSPDIAAEPKVNGAIMRINRDIRFSKDKTPYKLNCSAIIAPGGRKEGMGIPGMYIEMGPEHFRFYSGLYQPEKEVLYKVREYIIKHSAQLNKLVAEKEFVENYFKH